MEYIKEIYQYLRNNGFQVVTILLVLNLLSLLSTSELQSLLTLLTEITPNFLSDYLSQISIAPSTIFQVYKLVLFFQLVAFIYLFFGEKFYFPHMFKVKVMFEHSIELCVIFLLAGNLLSNLNVLEIGMIEQFNYYSSGSYINHIYIFINGINYLFLIFVIIGYFFTMHE